MDRPAAKALVLPFERQNLALPTSEHRWLFLNAHPLENPAQWVNGIVCEQGFRPLFNVLKTAGYDVYPEVDARPPFAGALVLTSRFKEINKQMVARAVQAVVPDAPILIAGEKTSGIASLGKWVGLQTPSLDRTSKFHAQVLRFSAHDAPGFQEVLNAVDSNTGVFGSGKIDAGSALLASTFDEKIKGDVADFCAGTGYLTTQLLEKSLPEKIDLYEAEFRALELARQVLSATGTPMDFHWLDLGREPVVGRYDWIVMNPPFHAGREAAPSIGQSMIRAARKALRPGGRLRLVANRQLPYENTLKEVFGGFREIVAADGFKVLQA